MKIDSNKLIKLIEASLASNAGGQLSESWCLGVVNGQQIQITVTSEAFDFMDAHSELTCISE